LFDDTAPTQIYTLSLHDALPIWEIVEPNAAEWEGEKRQPVAALKQAADAGLMGVETPVEAGGFGLSVLTKLALCEDMSRADMPFIFALINTQNVASRLSATSNPASSGRLCSPHIVR